MDNPVFNRYNQISDYFCARATAKDYPVNLDHPDGSRLRALEPEGSARQEILISLLNGSFSPMDNLAL